jgi:hypothetical protein
VEREREKREDRGKKERKDEGKEGKKEGSEEEKEGRKEEGRKAGKETQTQRRGRWSWWRELSPDDTWVWGSWLLNCPRTNSVV